MKDFIAKGTGNSRFLKSSISSTTTWEQFRDLLRGGTAPIDLNGINPLGVTEAGTPLSKGNLLSDETATKLGLNPANNPTVNDALNTIPSIINFANSNIMHDMNYILYKIYIQLNLTSTDVISNGLKASFFDFFQNTNLVNNSLTTALYKNKAYYSTTQQIGDNPTCSSEFSDTTVRILNPEQSYDFNDATCASFQGGWSSSGYNWCRYDIGSVKTIQYFYAKLLNSSTTQAYITVQYSSDGSTWTGISNDVVSPSAYSNVSKTQTMLARYFRIGFKMYGSGGAAGTRGLIDIYEVKAKIDTSVTDYAQTDIVSTNKNLDFYITGSRVNVIKSGDCDVEVYVSTDNGVTFSKLSYVSSKPFPFITSYNELEFYGDVVKGNKLMIKIKMIPKTQISFVYSYNCNLYI